MTDLFKFVGKDGSLGFIKDKIYMLTLVGHLAPTITSPTYCPYEAWEAFFKNWERV